MSYTSLLVHLRPGQPNTALLTVAGQLAERFKAHVIGIAACQPMSVVGGEGYVGGEVFADYRRRIMADLKETETEFLAAMAGKSTSIEWRSEITLAPLADYLANEAGSADLVITGSMPAAPLKDYRMAESGSLVMQAGRPVLIVPADTPPLRFERAVIGWKDTRECRIAISAALPLLKLSGNVTMLSIVTAEELDTAAARIKDVAAWLGRHGIVVDARVERSTGDDIDQMREATDRADADVVVVGAYGHSRLREWVLGGVTRDLLLGSKRCVLVSH